MLFYYHVPETLIYEKTVIEARIKQKHIKRLDLSLFENIVITNDVQSIEYLSDTEKFNDIKKILDNKEVKIEQPDGYIGYDENHNRIELNTGNNNYIMYGEFGEDARYLVLYDCTNYDIYELVFVVVEVSESDYKEIFEELDSSDEQNPDYSEIISDEQSDE